MTLVPRFTPSASAAASRLAAFSITIDNVRIVIVRPVADTLLDTTVVVQPGDTVLSLVLEVPHSSVGEALTAGLQLREGQSVLFSGEQTVTAELGDQAHGSDVPTTFVGPGASAVSLTITPRDTALLGADSAANRWPST